MTEKIREIKVGDVVKSQDFFHDETTYIVGVVEAIGDMRSEFLDGDRYKIRVLYGRARGELYHTNCCYMYPPVNGTLTMRGVCNGVSQVELP